MNESNQPKKSSSILSAFKAVAWSFLGIRTRSGYDSDRINLKPIHVILAGLILAFLFVLTLILIVYQVTAK
jgi:hypothetical protein